jgi:hypothetical protein
MRMVLHEMANALSQPAPSSGAHVFAGVAMSDPVLRYAAPSDVMLDHSLSRVGKIALLQHWHEDLSQRSLARSEGMVGGDEGIGRSLSAITNALRRLRNG